MRQIIFHEETKTFHLYNEKISYILCVLENGHLGQLYFGIVAGKWQQDQ